MLRLPSLLPRPSLVAALLSLLTLPLVASAEPDAATRAAFAEAYNAPSADNSQDSDTLRAYPLYPWLYAARLRQALADGTPESQAAALEYLETAGDVAHVRDLRRALLLKASNENDWVRFLALWRDSASNDALACRKLEARRAGGDTEALIKDITARWLSEKSLPPECDAVLSWFMRQPVYTPVLVEQRLRVRLLDGDVTSAKALLPALAEVRRGRYEAWIRQLANPASEFSALAAGNPVLLDSEGLNDTWMRWARRAPSEAAALLQAVIAAQKLSVQQAQAMQLSTALALSWNRDVEAVQLFRQVPEELLDERGFEWRVRAALWAGEWNQAFNWLSLMPPAMAEQPRWRYWSARALETLGQKTEALQRYRSLATENDTYGLLAAWRAGKGWTPKNEPNPITAIQQAALEATPSFIRAQEAWRTDYKSIASLEWRDTLDALPAELAPAMVREAAALGWYDQAIVTATRLNIFRDLDALFPRPYKDLVQKAAEDSGIPASWLYGVMRKESAFRADATSSAGAMGLLQMMPGTAAMTAKAAGRAVPKGDELKDPAINVPLAALHLREVLDKSEGRWQMALAAYNAGFRAVTRWRPPATMDADVWIENIPYNETRTYVQRILFHVGVYQWLETGKPVRANNWLPPVEPVPVTP